MALDLLHLSTSHTVRSLTLDEIVGCNRGSNNEVISKTRKILV